MTGYISAADLAHLHKMTMNQVYVMACLNKWGRYREGGNGRVFYCLSDVAETMNRGEAE